MRNTQLRPLQISSTLSPAFISMLPSPGCRWPEKSKEKAVKSNLILRLIPPDLIMITGKKNSTNQIYPNDTRPCCRQPAFKRVSESTEFKVKYLFKGAGVIDSQSKANTRVGTIQWTIKVRATPPPRMSGATAAEGPPTRVSCSTLGIAERYIIIINYPSSLRNRGHWCALPRPRWRWEFMDVR